MLVVGLCVIRYAAAMYFMWLCSQDLSTQRSIQNHPWPLQCWESLDQIRAGWYGSQIWYIFRLWQGIRYTVYLDIHVFSKISYRKFSNSGWGQTIEGTRPLFWSLLILETGLCFCDEWCAMMKDHKCNENSTKAFFFLKWINN